MAGSPAAAWQPVSLRTILRPSPVRRRHGKVVSATWAVAPAPPPKHPPLVQPPTAVAAHHPAVMRHACAAHLLGAATGPEGRDPRQAVGVDDVEHGRSGHADPRPVLRRLQEAQEPRPCGEAGEQRPIVARQPARERTRPAACERLPEPERPHLTGPEERLGVGAYKGRFFEK